jgi:hypothetical protein
MNENITPQELLKRVDAVERRLLEFAAAEGSDRLTAPDEATGERWDNGQVWAHVAEFVPYWLGQADRVIAARNSSPVPFGRVKTDASRLEPIEQGRHEPVGAQMDRLRLALEQLRLFISSQDEETWEALGVHQSLGVLTVGRLIQELIVKHLEEHADQLQEIAA